LAKAVRLYCFYGTFRWETKNVKKESVFRVKPVLFWVHKKTMNGRSRFVADVSKHFAKFIRMCRERGWQPFLEDKGDEEAPMEYLAAIESGLRNYAMHSVHTMGTKALRSRAYWAKVDPWRKREAYIALVRFLRGLKADYNQWDCFLWCDYTQRKRATVTFNRRHLPLSDGMDEENFDGHLEFDWEEHHYSPKKKVKQVKAAPRVKKSAPRNTTQRSKQTENQIMVYDVEKDCLVPM
jgi:hypothetical protein